MTAPLISHVHTVEFTSHTLIHPPSDARASAAQKSCPNIDFNIDSSFTSSPREETSSHLPNGSNIEALNLHRAKNITLNDRVHESLKPNRDIDKSLKPYRDFRLAKEPYRGSTASTQWDTSCVDRSLNYRDNSLVYEPHRGSEQVHPLPDIDIPSWVYMESRPNLEHMLQEEQLLVSSFNFAALVHASENYRAGNLKNFTANWECLTSDKEIMSIIKYGLRLNTKHYIAPREGIQYHLPENEIKAIDKELSAMCQKGIVRKTKSTPGDYVSPIFMREKSNGATRMILNLKQLNKQINKKHFKMESIRNVKHMIRKNCWMASVDLQDAYYSIPIHPKHTKFLKFLWKDILYEYTCLPNGYSDAMRIFTKVLKPVYGHLRMIGFQSVSYVDDNFLQGQEWQDCQDNINATTNVLTSLGYTIHMVKSILEPRQELEFLGFVLNSRDMTIAIKEKKKIKIKSLCDMILRNQTPSIRQVAKLIGNLAATEEAYPLAPFHYRPIELDKIEALDQQGGDYDAPITLGQAAYTEILWWRNNIDALIWPIHFPRVDMVIYTDASEEGWGATHNGTTANGRWTKEDLSPMNINFLEIMAVKFAIFSFCKNNIPKHIRIMTDNTTAESHINHQGGTKSPRCNGVAREIWKWAEYHNVWISAAYIPGILNVDADEQSREFDDATEWSISDFVFDKMVQMWGAPDIDLFASRINAKISTYVSWRPDPGSVAIDAFTLSWDRSFIYCFPPFSIIWKTLEKIQRDQAEALVVMPLWPTQSWFPCLMSMLTDHPMVFSANQLLLPNKPKARHPLYFKLKLAVMRLSGNPLRNINFVQRVKASSWHHGGHKQGNDMRLQLENGMRFLSRKTSIPFILL